MRIMVIQVGKMMIRKMINLKKDNYLKECKIMLKIMITINVILFK
jgi:hypothetical protein